LIGIAIGVIEAGMCKTVVIQGGLRVEMGQVEFGLSAAQHVRRAKDGKASVHPIRTMSCGC